MSKLCVWFNFKVEQIELNTLINANMHAIADIYFYKQLMMLILMRDLNLRWEPWREFLQVEIRTIQQRCIVCIQIGDIVRNRTCRLMSSFVCSWNRHLDWTCISCQWIKYLLHPSCIFPWNGHGTMFVDIQTGDIVRNRARRLMTIFCMFLKSYAI